MFMSLRCRRRHLVLECGAVTEQDLTYYSYLATKWPPSVRGVVNKLVKRVRQLQGTAEEPPEPRDSRIDQLINTVADLQAQNEGLKEQLGAQRTRRVTAQRQEAEQAVAVLEPIPGSRFYRAYCSRCHVPLRATESQLRAKVRDIYCEECSPGQPPPAHAGLTPRQRSGLTRTSS
jgi:hypothetical protein